MKLDELDTSTNHTPSFNEYFNEVFKEEIEAKNSTSKKEQQNESKSAKLKTVRCDLP